MFCTNHRRHQFIRTAKHIQIITKQITKYILAALDNYSILFSNFPSLCLNIWGLHPFPTLACSAVHITSVSTWTYLQLTCLKIFSGPVYSRNLVEHLKELVIKGTPYELTIETAVLADQITKRLSSIHRVIKLGLGLQAKLLGHDFLIRLQNKLLLILKLIAKLAKLDHISKGFTIKHL